MKCSNVRKKIDLLAYHDNPDPGADIYRHIDSCKACAKYLEDTRLVAGKIGGIRDREPVLKNPGGLTEDIMKAIREESQVIPSQTGEKSGKYQGIIILRRLLAAASVCLFLVFGYEEYILVDKISRLEKQNAAISQSSRYHAALQLKKAVSILASDPEMFVRYKEIKTRKIYLSSLFRTAIYYEVYGITPDALKLISKEEDNVTKSTFISIFKQFDTTLHSVKQ